MIEADDLADYRWIGVQVCLPKPVAKNGDWWSVRRILAGWIKDSSISRRGSNLLKVVGADEAALHGLSIVQMKSGRHGCDDGGKGSGVVAIEDGGGIRKPGRSVVRGSPFKPDERRWIPYRHGLEHIPVEESKGGDVDTDADRQHQHGCAGEGGRAEDHASGVAEILDQAIEPGPAPGFAGLFVEMCPIAKIAARFRASSAIGHFTMEGHFGFEFAVTAIAVHEVAHTPHLFRNGAWNGGGNLANRIDHADLVMQISTLSL